MFIHAPEAGKNLMVEMKKNTREITKVGMMPSAELVFVVKKTISVANDIDVSERSSMLLETAKYSSFSIDRILKKRQFDILVFLWG